MKQLLFLLALFISSLASYSQAFVDTTKLWNVTECSSGPFGVMCLPVSYKLEGDTTIGSNLYKKLYKTSDTTLTSWFLNGAMRDSVQMVYYHDFIAEYLIYNFAANVGDTIKPISFCANNYLIVDSVDTVIVHGQLKRRLIFNFPSCAYVEEWIEDIGSNHGVINELLVNGNLVPDGGTDLLCYWQSDTVKWINQVYNDCYFRTVGIQEQNSSISIRIFPNPFSDFTIVQLQGLKGKWSWTLYNSIGQTVQFVDNIAESQLKIEKGDLIAGVYMYQVRKEKQVVSTGKLMLK